MLHISLILQDSIGKSEHTFQLTFFSVDLSSFTIKADRRCWFELLVSTLHLSTHNTCSLIKLSQNAHLLIILPQTFSVIPFKDLYSEERKDYVKRLSCILSLSFGHERWSRAIGALHWPTWHSWFISSEYNSRFHIIFALHHFSCSNITCVSCKFFIEIHS